MPFRVKDRLTYRLERWLQRGALYQILAIAALIAAVAVTGGLLAWLFSDAFDHPGIAVWWAFLRLSDPGYLGDDEGAFLRILATVITVLGYVLFMGSLIAILTQWLNATMRRLESGLTPITIRDHVLILGWTNRTATLVRELLLSEGRVRRFLRGRGARRLRIVILAETVDAALMQELRDRLGAAWNQRRVILRSGSSLRIEHLRRVAYAEAAVILIPGADFLQGGSEATDTRTVKTLISIANQRAEGPDADGPAVVAEIFDTRKIPIARRAFSGDVDVLASDAFIGRLIAQNVRHTGLSYVYDEVLTHEHGNELYIRHLPAFAGATLREIDEHFPGGVLLGAVRPDGRGFRPFLNPPPDFRLRPEDRLVILARSYEGTTPGASGRMPTPIRRAAPEVRRVLPRRRILILGWSHKVRALVHEFGSYPTERFQIDVLSRVPSAEREARLARVEQSPGVAVAHLDGDYTVESDLAAARPEAYDNVVFLGSDWLESGEDSDARTILGYVLLRAMVPAGAPRPQVLVELMDPENARLFTGRAGEVIISPLILSNVLAHVALRRELSVVFNELFGPGGAEIFFRSAREYKLDGEEATFRDVRRSAARHGEIALGIRRQDASGPPGGVLLNPPATARWTLAPDDEVVVLTTT